MVAELVAYSNKLAVQYQLWLCRKKLNLSDENAIDYICISHTSLTHTYLRDNYINIF